MGGRTGGVTTDITLMEPQRRTPRRCAADRNDSLTIRRPNASGRVAAHSRHLCDRPPRREGAGNPDDQRCPSASRSHLPFILRFTSTRGSCHRRQQQRGDATPRCVGGGMASGEKCRARAKECIEAADRADDPKSRLILLDLARRWLFHADQADTLADRHELRGDALLDHPDTTR